jgi:hypothetical protein
VTSAEQTAAQPATAELLALAAATRPDIDLRDLQGLLADVHAQGKPSWPVVMVQTVRMLAQRDGDVRGLRAALLDPLGLAPKHRRPNRTHF